MINSLKTLALRVIGERYTLKNVGDIKLEHLHRYVVAERLAQGKTVLNIASGESYGSFLLAGVARHVIGVDVSPSAIMHASQKYSKDNLEYRTGHCTALPLLGNSVDMVVSLETVKYHDQHDAIMAEFKRVLTPNGVLIILCADKYEYSDEPCYNNLSHVKELYRNEFESLVAANFKQVAIFSQRIVYGSRIFPENCSGEFFSYSITDRNPESITSFPGELKPLYFIALASDIELPPIASSFLDQPISECNLAKYAARLSLAISAHESVGVKLNQSLLEKEKQLSTLQHLLQEGEEQLSNLHQELVEKEDQLAELLSSKSWRLTEPFRSLRRYILPSTLKRFSENKTVVELESQPYSFDKAPDGDNRLFDSSDFDGEFYRKAYPHSHGLDPYYHYVKYGKNEGCLPCRPKLKELDDVKSKLDQSKDTVLVVSHDASRTGAPILSLNIIQQLKKKYNVIVWLLGGGDLSSEFEKHSALVVNLSQKYSNLLFSCVLDRLENEVKIKFAIVNSIVSSSVLSSLAHCFIPSLILIHEFASYIRPHNIIPDAILWASDVVFSASIVHENSVAQYAAIKEHHVLILPQGKCVVPHDKGFDDALELERQKIRKLFRPQHLPADAVVIIGAGAVEMRKGVDLFLACAARVLKLNPENVFRFIWVGHGFDPEKDTTYSVYLQDQINRTGLENFVCFTGEVNDIEFAYQLSDMLFLSARLDPLPNVAIDAMFQQLPVICFQETTGIADLLKDNGFGEDCVVSYLDVEQAAQKIVALIDDKEKRKQLGYDIKNLAAKLFNMEAYVNSLEQQALGCAAMQEAEKNDCLVIEKAGILQLDYFSPPIWSAMTLKEAIRAFVRTWRVGLNLRKPFPGFHPGIYKDQHVTSTTNINPLVDFIEKGKPEGPWLCQLIQPSLSVHSKITAPLRSALHIHAFFVDLFIDIFQRIERQNLPLDLLISVPSTEVAEKVTNVVSRYASGNIDIRVVPNRGRDIGAFLSEFGSTILKCYDIIGHVHTKKSGDLNDSAMGQIWANFLLENLIGGKFPMASRILERMMENEKLGLVFPEDPYVVGWTANKQIAQDLAHQLQLNKLPENNFNFPVGNMFWARTEALKPLLVKNFSWEDYPEEPLPYDGSMLHAIERLLPFVAQKMNYHVATTYVPGITR